MMIRASLILLATLVLTACGFTPMHQSTGGQYAYDNIAIVMGAGEDEIDRSVGFLIEQRLKDRIGTSGAEPRYTLTIDPRVTQVSLGLTGLDRASRFDNRVRARWNLQATDDTDFSARGQAESVATYSAERDPYQLYATDLAAQQRTARDVADRILADIALELAKRDS